eukprot:CAMPEP_0171984170 /NCGR_PEP_ID=MMETSP0993-20121228/273685_1 /TAXON_ID=483369 /ORGANISM="non described non described, Strain CCMP2098" /LENGTH=840 /DNA_ID=CAMNT_0012636975 /DNA_START=1 /DNA_END=2523 /DNA_ORIENTATION=-
MISSRVVMLKRTPLLVRLSAGRQQRRLLSAAVESSLPASVHTLINAASPFIPKFMTDLKLDAEHTEEKRRLDNFHTFVEHLDRKVTKPFPSDLVVDLSKYSDDEHSNLLEADAFTALVLAVRAEAREKRDLAQNRLWAYAGALELDQLGDQLDGGTGQRRDGGKEVASSVDAGGLAMAAMRLRLVENCCGALLRSFPTGTGCADDGGLLAQWRDGFTSLRNEHGVLVSLPSLLSRTLGVTRTNKLGTFLSSLSAHSASSSPSPSTAAAAAAAAAGGSGGGGGGGELEEELDDDEEEEAVWPCPLCTVHNPLSTVSCEVCAEERPTEHSPSLSAHSASSSPSPSTAAAAAAAAAGGSGGGGGGGDSGSSVDGGRPLIRRDLVLSCVRACSEGGYDDRLAAHLNLFASAASGSGSEPGAGSDDKLKGVNEATSSTTTRGEEEGGGRAAGREEAKSLSWEEAEAVLQVVSEFSALALRDELSTFVAVNPAHKTHARLTAAAAAQKEQTQEGKQEDSVNGGGGEGAEAAAVAAAVTRGLRVKALSNYEPLHGDQGHAVAAAPSSPPTSTSTSTSTSSPPPTSSTSSTSTSSSPTLSPLEASNLTSSILLHGMDKAGDQGHAVAAAPSSPPTSTSTSTSTSSPPPTSSTSSTSTSSSPTLSPLEASNLTSSILLHGMDKASTASSASVSSASSSDTEKDGTEEEEEEWAAAWPITEGREGKAQRNRVKQHARVWLLHDFDHTQKWRCCFAWAQKKAAPPQPVEKNSKLDFFGTAILDGEVTAEELIESQRTHFKELAGFSQHFSAAYKTKQVEEYMTRKGNRETARIGVAFVLAVSIVDSVILER